MRIENGKIFLEDGEKLYDAVLLEVKEMQGVSSKTNKAYHFFNCRLDLQLVNPDGEIRIKPAESFLDIELGAELQKIKPYTHGQAIYTLGYDPTSEKAGKFVTFIPAVKQPVQQSAQK